MAIAGGHAEPAATIMNEIVVEMEPCLAANASSSPLRVGLSLWR